MRTPTMLEFKIGYVLVNIIRGNYDKIDGRSRRILVEDAWRKRCEFNRIANDCNNPKLFKKVMFGGYGR